MEYDVQLIGQAKGVLLMATTAAHLESAQKLEVHHSQGIQELTEVIVRRFPSFYRQALRQLGNAADAEDAVQDAFLSAYAHLNQFKGQAQLSTWLTTIVINAARMQARRRSRELHVPLDQRDEGEDRRTLAEQLSDHGPGPEEICLRQELAEMLDRLSARLSPTLRRTLQLRELDGLSTREAAQVLGVPAGTIKARLAKARAILKPLIQNSLGGKCGETVNTVDIASRKSQFRRCDRLGGGAKATSPVCTYHDEAMLLKRPRRTARGQFSKCFRDGTRFALLCWEVTQGSTARLKSV
jgi:RNA polymerase sigma-70 factor (ECF subfamily)